MNESRIPPDHRMPPDPAKPVDRGMPAAPLISTGPRAPGRRPIWTALWFYLVILFVLVPVIVIVWLAVAGDPERQFHITEETTVVTGPLTRNGLVDYSEALRRRHLAEVPAEENASRLILEALGPSIFTTQEMAQLAYDELEMSPLPQSGDYRIALDALLFRQAAEAGEAFDVGHYNSLVELLTPCTQVPWSAADYPEFAAWVAANELPLEKVYAASRMPAMRHPVLLPPGGSLMDLLLPMTQELRDFGRLLTLRAMQRVANGDPAGAWDDILALHRLSRLQAQGDTLIEYLVAIANSATATNAMQELISSPAMTPELLDTIEADWESLAPWPDIADVVNQTERHMTLDVVQRTARFGPATLMAVMGAVGYSGGSGGYLGFPTNGEMTRAINAMVDWDEVLIETNRWFDQITIALGEPDPTLRATLIHQFQRDVESLASETRFAWWPSTYNIGGKILSSMLPAIGGMDRAITKRDARDAIVESMFAVEQYRRDTGRLPASLAELAPEYLSVVPLDPHAPAEQLRYLIQGDDGYVLYSVGDNGFDDGGLTESQDITFRVRMPPPDWLQAKPVTPGESTPDPGASSQVQ
jgi:hypothetical protein